MNKTVFGRPINKETGIKPLIKYMNKLASAMNFTPITVSITKSAAKYMKISTKR